MKVITSYPVHIKEYSHIFDATVTLYRAAVDHYIHIAMKEWDNLKELDSKRQLRYIEKVSHVTKANPSPAYDLISKDRRLYKLPCYLRRAAINKALGDVSSYMSRKARWDVAPVDARGKEPGLPVVGMAFPAMYKGNCYERTGLYSSELKVFHQNTWTWLNVELRKSDADDIVRHCANRKECVPTLTKNGKSWALVFAFEEKVKLNNTPVKEQRILAVDLGINNACTCSVMTSDGTILHRDIYSLDKEYDSLHHTLNKVRQAQQYGNYKTPRLWAVAKGINDRISVLTVNHITELAVEHKVSCVVLEHLNTRGKKRGASKQKLHHWRGQHVQAMLVTRCHRMGIRISRVNAWGTSALAFDGSGKVQRSRDNYSICAFTTGKTYHCDLNASYNIGARYFIRELLKSCTATSRSDIEAKVSQCTARSTCTLSTLISLNAVLAA